MMQQILLSGMIMDKPCKLRSICYKLIMSLTPHVQLLLSNKSTTLITSQIFDLFHNFDKLQLYDLCLLYHYEILLISNLTAPKSREITMSLSITELQDIKHWMEGEFKQMQNIYHFEESELLKPSSKILSLGQYAPNGSATAASNNENVEFITALLQEERDREDVSLNHLANGLALMQGPILYVGQIFGDFNPPED